MAFFCRFFPLLLHGIFIDLTIHTSTKWEYWRTSLLKFHIFHPKNLTPSTCAKCLERILKILCGRKELFQLDKLIERSCFNTGNYLSILLLACKQFSFWTLPSTNRVLLWILSSVHVPATISQHGLPVHANVWPNKILCDHGWGIYLWNHPFLHNSGLVHSLLCPYANAH